jgi:peptidyl-prolyl cis-trans isomerase D
MFDLVRKHTKVLMFLMFLLIIPAFVLVGVDGYSRMNEAGQAVARVGGNDISQAEWDAAHRNEVDRTRASMPTVDVALLDTPQARYAVLERLVRERVLAEAADKLHLATSDTRLARDLQQNPTIAALRRPDGTLDMDRYRALVAGQGMTPEMFEARVRRDLSLRQVESGVLATNFSVPAVADVSLGAFFEKRDVQVQNFAATAFAGQVKVTDAELETFYKANTTMFQAPESVDIEYLVLDQNAVKNAVAINEAELKSYYDQNVARLSGIEERRASHILITAAKDAPAADREKAKAKATALLAEVRKNPAQFAELAKKNSQDPGSAPNGGDLDFFARGAMVKPFEDAAFAMKKGDISDVVESDFGYHIIQLTDVKAPKQKTFEELRAGLESDLKAQMAQTKFAESAEAFINGVYEQYDSLKPTADKFKLQVQTASNVQRTPAPGATGPLADASFLGALFSDDALNGKRNTKGLELGGTQVVSGRVVKHSAAHTRSFAEVKEEVRTRLTAQRAAELARTAGAARLAAWKAKPDDAASATTAVVSRDEAQGLPGPVVDAALKADPAALPAFVGVDLGTQGYAVVKVLRIASRAPPAAMPVQQAQAQIAQLWASAENQAYYQMLKERYKARINVPAVVTAPPAAGSALR